jgi:hypothetical protein
MLTTDLFFRAKLDGVVRAAGFSVVRGLPAAVAVVELGRPDALVRIPELVGAGARVLAFGSHVHADVLRRARELGAESVPNSRAEDSLRRVLADVAGA